MDRLDAVSDDHELQQLTLAACKADVALWVDDWVWTFDPRETVSDIPFELFPRQREFLHWLSDREQGEEDGIAEKCRDVGFTWLCCAYAVHGWLFREGYAVGFGSRKLDLVDKLGDPDCIFEKMRFIINSLPHWMRPKDYDDGWCKILNRDMGSSITGEGGDQIGRGGRKSIYFVDEAAFLEHSQRVNSALSQTSRVKIWVSTPNGQGNDFYKKRHSGRYPVFTFRWQDDPRKGQEWYEKQKADLDPVTLAQEVDIDYTASIEGICIPAKWVQAAVEFDKWLESTLEILKLDGPMIAGLDIADGGANNNVMVFRRGWRVEAIEAWAEGNTTRTAWKARELAQARGATTVNYDCIGVGSGVRGSWEASDTKLPFDAVPINGGSAPTNTYWPDDRSSEEMFINLRAEAWWMLRVRFEKCYEWRELDIPHPIDECISIPNDQNLMSDLSLPLVERVESGKIRLEGKPKMAQRGVKSPDYADALSYAFTPYSPGLQIIIVDSV